MAHKRQSTWQRPQREEGKWILDQLQICFRCGWDWRTWQATSCETMHFCCSMRLKYSGSFQPNCGASETTTAANHTRNIMVNTRRLVREWMQSTSVTTQYLNQEEGCGVSTCSCGQFSTGYKIGNNKLLIDTWTCYINPIQSMYIACRTGVVPLKGLWLIPKRNYLYLHEEISILNFQ